MAIPLRRSDPANIVAGCRTFFVTSSIAEKRNLLQSHRSAELFIITVGHEISIERAVQFIKGGFAFRAGRELRFTPPVWERGFSEVRIYGSEALARVWEYIAQNPVKRRLVQRPAEYAYSSSNARFELDEVPQGLKPTGDLPLVGTSEDVP